LHSAGPGARDARWPDRPDRRQKPGGRAGGKGLRLGRARGAAGGVTGRSARNDGKRHSMTQLAEQKTAPLSDLTRFADDPARNGDAVAQWLDALRKPALARFDPATFPWTRDEHWRHTNFAPLLKTPFRPAPPGSEVPADAVAYSLGYEAAAELVFVNGRYAPHLSRPGRLPRGVRVTSLAEAIAAGEPLVERHLGRL